MRRPSSRRSPRKTSKREPFIRALAAAILLFLAQSLLQWVVGWFTRLFNFQYSTDLLFLCLPPLACIGLVCLFVMKWKSVGDGEGLRFMGLKPVSGRQIAAGVMLSLPVLAGYLWAVRDYLSRGIPVSLFPEWPALLVLFAVSAGLYEELAFRGFLFQYLRPGRSFLSAAALSSLLWALSHWGSAFMAARVRVFFPEVMVFLLGLAGAYVFEKSGNAIWSWMIVHFTVDCIGLVNIGNTGLLRAPVGSPMRYLFGGEVICLLLAFPLARWFWPDGRRKKASGQPIP